MKAPYSPPNDKELAVLIGPDRYAGWLAVCALVESLYDMDRLWGSGGKTLCALYAREGCAGVMLIFGKDERAAFAEARTRFSPAVQQCYDEAATYHDGK